MKILPVSFQSRRDLQGCVQGDPGGFICCSSTLLVLEALISLDLLLCFISGKVFRAAGFEGSCVWSEHRAGEVVVMSLLGFQTGDPGSLDFQLLGFPLDVPTGGGITLSGFCHSPWTSHHGVCGFLGGLDSDGTLRGFHDSIPAQLCSFSLFHSVQKVLLLFLSVAIWSNVGDTKPDLGGTKPISLFGFYLTILCSPYPTFCAAGNKAHRRGLG